MTDSTSNWATNWEETVVLVERVIAYWSRVLTPAEMHYSATEREALAAKESLVCFQPFIEGERILLVTDHAVLMWAKTYKNANRRLAAWGLVFAAFPQLVIVHRPGRAHSNVDPLSRLPRIPEFVSPEWNDLPSPSVSTEYKELQQAWSTFIQERELAVESHFMTTHSRRSQKRTLIEPSTSANPLKGTIEPFSRSSVDSPNSNIKLHVFADQEVLKRFLGGYHKDKDFAAFLNHT
jgi:hypothetical protein